MSGRTSYKPQGRKKCTNCWKSNLHDPSDCPERERTTAESEKRRVALGCYADNDWKEKLRRESVLRADLPCTNCWEFGAGHTHRNCPKRRLTIRESNRLRLKKGVPCNEYWFNFLGNNGCKDLQPQAPEKFSQQVRLQAQQSSHKATHGFLKPAPKDDDNSGLDALMEEVVKQNLLAREQEELQLSDGSSASLRVPNSSPPASLGSAGVDLAFLAGNSGVGKAIRIGDEFDSVVKSNDPTCDGMTHHLQAELKPQLALVDEHEEVVVAPVSHRQRHPWEYTIEPNPVKALYEAKACGGTVDEQITKSTRIVEETLSSLKIQSKEAVSPKNQNNGTVKPEAPSTPASPLQGKANVTPKLQAVLSAREILLDFLGPLNTENFNVDIIRHSLRMLTIEDIFELHAEHHANLRSGKEATTDKGL